MLKPCHLTFNKKFEWLSKDRSNSDGSLSVSFLSEVAAAVQIDLQHALSRTIRNDLHAINPQTTYEVVRPKLNRDAVLGMMKERIKIQNMCCSGDTWNEELNKFLQWTCVNYFMHKIPKTFQSELAWREHRLLAPVILVEAEAEMPDPTPTN